MILTKLRDQFVNNYYLLFVIVGLTQMLGISGVWTIISYLSFLFALTIVTDLEYSICDLLVCFFIIYSLSTYFLFGDYPIEIFIASIRDQIFPISFYFFARSKHMQDCQIMHNAIIPLVISFIIGFFLFFLSPSWYIDYRLNGDYNRSIGNYYNLTRMSSFWSSSYFVGYSALFVIIYIISNTLFYNEKIRYYGIILLISFLALLFAQQRISIGFLGLFLIIACVYSLKNRIISPKLFFIYLFAIILLIMIVVILITTYMDEEYVTFVIERSTESEDGMIEDRINLFEEYISSISFLGDGFGKYSHNAMLYDMPCISDCEYIRTPNEIGIFGMGLFLFIALSSFSLLTNRNRLLCFESFCLAFYLLAMIGATPLEVSQQQPFLLWYCIGKAQNYG